MAENHYIDTRGCAERPVTLHGSRRRRASGWRRAVRARAHPGAFPGRYRGASAAALRPARGAHLPGVRRRPARRDRSNELMAQAYGDNFDDERICPITSLYEPTPTCWNCGTVPRARSRTWRCSACRGSSPQAPPSCANRGSSTTTSSSLWPHRATPARRRSRASRDVDGVSIGVMYPDGGVSDIQCKQMATQRGRQRAGVGRARQLRRLPDRRRRSVFGDEEFAGAAAWKSTAWRSPARTPSTGGASCPRSCTTCRPTPQLVRRRQVRDWATLAGRVRTHRQLRQHPGRLLRQAAWARRMGMLYVRQQREPRAHRLHQHGHLRHLRAPVRADALPFHGHPRVLEPGAPAVRADGARRRGHSRTGWTTCASSATSAWTSTRSPSVRGAVRRRLHRQRHVPWHHSSACSTSTAT